MSLGLTLTERALLIIADFLFIIATQLDKELKALPTWVVWLFSPVFILFFLWCLK
jgi:hypothetical protein